MWCSQSQKDMAKTILEGNVTDIPNFDQGKCEKKPIFMNLALASILGIKSLPYFIREDGIHKVGMPTNSQNFVDWLRLNETK